MSPRRKKAEEDAATPSTGGEAESTPKKKRVPRKKADAVSKAEPKAAPLEIPIARPIAPPPVMQPEAPIMPARITIEPDTRHEPDVVAGEEPWKPPQKDDPDLSVPPRVLLQGKKVPRQEVEDILEEIDEEDDRDDRPGFHTPVRSGLFRKLAVAFGVLVVIMALMVGYISYSRATIVVHPKRAEVRTERVLSVAAEPSGPDGLAGEIEEVTVAGEKTGAPSGSTVADAVATGFATIYNTTGSDQVLVATTRLLTADGVLFRLKSRVNVPAKGQIKTEVYADKPGKGSEIGPSKFTIPGLSADLQTQIYADSDEAMAGGTTSSGIATDEDIEGLENALRAQLTLQAREELAKRASDQQWSGEALLAETMSRFVNVAPGESTDSGIMVRLTLRVRSVRYDRAKAVTAAVEDLKRGLTSDRELVAVNGDEAEIVVEKADPKTGNALLRVALRGESVVSIQSPLFDAEKLRGLSLAGVKTYFDAIEGVERVDVKFRPFWLKRMPDLKDHIKFEIAK